MRGALCENLIIVCIENLHVGFVGCYGNSTVDTEHLDRLAAEAVVFDNYYAPLATCAAVRGTLFSGGAADPRATGTWAGLPHRVAWLGPQASLERFHQLLDRTFTHAVGIEPPAGPEQVIAAAVAWLSDHHAEGPFVLWLDVPGLEPPRNVPPEWLEIYEKELTEAGADEQLALTTFQKLQQEGLAGQPIEEDELEARRVLWGALVERPDVLRYAAAVTWVDDAVGSLLSALRESVLWDRTAIVVTSDHGERILAAEEAAEAIWVTDERTHLPLIVRLPDGQANVGRCRSLIGPAVVGQTLRAIVGGDEANSQAEDLTDVLLARAEPPGSSLVLRAPDGGEWGLRTPEWLFVTRLDPRAELKVRDELEQEEVVLAHSFLFAKPEDRWERHSLHRVESARCVELFERLRELASGE